MISLGKLRNGYKGGGGGSGRVRVVAFITAGRGASEIFGFGMLSFDGILDKVFVFLVRACSMEVEDYDSIYPCSICDNVTGFFLITVAGEFIIHIGSEMGLDGRLRNMVCHTNEMGVGGSNIVVPVIKGCCTLSRQQDFLRQGIFPAIL